MNTSFPQLDGLCIGLRPARQFFRRNHQPQRVQLEPWTAGNDEIAAIQQSLIVFPRGQLQKLVGPDDEIQMIVWVLAVKMPHGVNRVVDLRRRPVHFRFCQRRNEAGMARACENHHSVAVYEWRQKDFGLMRRPGRWNEVNGIQMEPALRGLCDRNMPCVNRIERSTEKRHASATRSGWAFWGGVGRQRCSPYRVAEESGSTGALLAACSVASAPFGTVFGILSSALAMPLTSCTIPSPDADETA